MDRKNRIAETHLTLLLFQQRKKVFNPNPVVRKHVIVTHKSVFIKDLTIGFTKAFCYPVLYS